MNEIKDGRTRILESATEVFSVQGYHSASIRTVAKRAGVTNPAIYYHFESKQGLYEAALESTFEMYLEKLELPLSQAQGFRELLNTFINTTVELASTRPELGRLVFLSLYVLPESDQPTAARDRFVNEIKGILLGWFGKYLPEEEEYVLHLSVLTFLSLVAGAVQGQLVGLADLEFSPTVVEQIVHFFLRGIGVEK